MSNCRYKYILFLKNLFLKQEFNYEEITRSVMTWIQINIWLNFTTQQGAITGMNSLMKLKLLSNRY